MVYKNSNSIDLVSENEYQMLLELMELSSPATHKGDLHASLNSLLDYLQNYFSAKESWIIEEEGDEMGLLWHLTPPYIKEKILIGDFHLHTHTEGATYFTHSIEKPFLMYSHHLIFPFTIKEKEFWVGFSKSEVFDIPNDHGFPWQLIAGRLKELCAYQLQVDNDQSDIQRFDTIFDQMPQAIAFSEHEVGVAWLNKEARKLLGLSTNQAEIDSQLFSEKFAAFKEKVINKEEVDLMGNNIFSLGGAFPSSFGEDWIWKFENSVLKVIRKQTKINDKEGELWVFDNVSELYYANERLNSLFRTLNVAYDEINANLTEFQTKSTGKKSITDLEAEESRIIQQYDNNDILGKVTHDLRTPFAKVYTIVQLLLSDQQENLTAQQVERINLIKAVVADGLQIVKGFLDTGNMVLDEKKFKPENVDIQKLVDESLMPYELLSAKKNIIFITQILGKNMHLKVDRTYLKRIIDNLVSNAIKFSPFETQINYTISREGDSIIFSVKDQGPGLSDDDKSRLFKKYQQLSAKPIGTDESTGLGLYIVKSMVDKMGGKIRVESEKGQGANFLVSFPSPQK